MAKPACAMLATVSRSMWQPSGRRAYTGAARRWITRRGPRSARTCSKKRSSPPGRMTRRSSVSARVRSDTRAPWPQQLRGFVVSLTAVLRAHPSAAVLIGSLPTTASENALRATEVALDILRRAGFSPEEAVHITLQIVRTTTSMVIAELDEIPAPGDTAVDKEAFFRSLPPARFPRVIEAAGPLSEHEEPEGFYDLVIELILAGIEAASARRANPPRSASLSRAPRPPSGERP
jgi:hypothetical protein